MSKLVIRHDLHLMTKEELNQYLRDVSEYVGIDPDLNAFDAIWMPNESGNGQALVVYARRGTAEILRNKLSIDVDSLTHEVIDGSIVFTAKGHNIQPETGRPWRTEVAIGSKYIKGLEGKVKDDAIMTASTRALRRLTMQFTTLGILDESEVASVKAEPAPANPAAAATLAPVPMPAIFTQPTVPANNAPGKPVDPPAAPIASPAPFVGQQDQIDEAMAQVAKKAESKVDLTIHDLTKPEAAKVEAAAVAIVAPEATAPASRPKRTRKPKNTVSLDVEPEVVSAKQAVSTPVETAPASVPASVPAPEANPPAATQANSAAPTQAQPVSVAPVESNPIGMPTKEQMDNYRAKVGVYTQQLPASADLGSVQKMRAFITHYSGAAPQSMTVEQWEAQIKFFDEFAAKNGVKNLIKYINDSLGVK